MSRTLSLEKEELKALMKEVLEEFFDPDYGLEIHPEIMKLLERSSREKEEGKGVSLEEARRILGY